ncbi:MAG: glycoside hydrolase family 16 protein [Ginsengibacter sp.]
MKYFNKCLVAFYCFIILLSAASCKKNYLTNSTTKPSVISAATTYTLVWSDEFDGTSVNTANWNFETGGGGWGNNEKEYYQASNATVANGNLVITAKKQRIRGSGYTSARMTTQGKREFTYGKMEARIMLPMVKGLWPAFWMLGANINTVGWPACGETDIMEHINTENVIYGTVHWDNNGHQSLGGNTTTTPGDYHIYAIEWDPASIRWYVDGVKYYEANIQSAAMDELQKPSFLILNLAVGGNWPGQTIDNTKLPASMYVDYVRVYQ